MKRKEITLDGRRASYLDNERDGRALVVLHGHFGCGAIFSFLDDIYPGRVLLLDQRGHGSSQRGDSYKSADYVRDLTLFCDALHVEMPDVLGHSLGGIVAYHYAAESKNVHKLIVVDIGTEVDSSNDFILDFPRDFACLFEVRQAFEKAGMGFEPYFIESIRYDGVRWRFQFNYEDLALSQKSMNGDHWAWWDKIECPILLLHGRKTWACTTPNIEAMAARNKNTRLIIYDDAAHSPFEEVRERFCSDVAGFLADSR